MTESWTDGTAGGSAQREYDRRRGRDEDRVRAEWGRFGKLAVALTPERQSTLAWSSGAGGESKVGAKLDPIASATIRVLHDRRIPGSRANIDHVVVTTAGVWVIDAKRYVDRRPEMRAEGGILRPRVESLRVGGRDKTALVTGALGQAERVRSVVGGVPVVGALCFVDADWPLFGGALRVNGVEVLWPAKLVERLRAESGTVDVDGVDRVLRRRFPSA